MSDMMKISKRQGVISKMLSEEMKVTESELCSGCGVCVTVCSVKALRLTSNEKGELYSEIDPDKCILLFIV